MQLYTLVYWVLKPILKLLWRVETRGAENIPPSGGGIVCSNHTNAWDPVALSTRITRKIRYMAKTDLYRIPVFGWLLPLMGTVEVQREQSDRKAIREAIEHLHNGELIGIFPEGTRHRDGSIHPFMQGAAYLALKSGRPLYPAVVVANFGRLRTPLYISYGSPIYPPAEQSNRKGDLEHLTTALMQSILFLHSEGEAYVKEHSK